MWIIHAKAAPLFKFHGSIYLYSFWEYPYFPSYFGLYHKCLKGLPFCNCIASIHFLHLCDISFLLYSNNSDPKISLQDDTPPHLLWLSSLCYSSSVFTWLLNSLGQLRTNCFQTSASSTLSATSWLSLLPWLLSYATLWLFLNDHFSRFVLAVRLLLPCNSIPSFALYPSVVISLRVSPRVPSSSSCLTCPPFQTPRSLSHVPLRRTP